MAIKRSIALRIEYFYPGKQQEVVIDNNLLLKLFVCSFNRRRGFVLRTSYFVFLTTSPTPTLH